MMTSVMNFLLSIAMVVSMLLGSANGYESSAAEDAVPVNDVHFSYEYEGDFVPTFEETADLPAAAAEIDDAPVCAEETDTGIVVDKGVHKEAAVWENRPAPAIEADDAPMVCESIGCGVVGEGVSFGEAEAMILPAPPIPQ